MRYLAALLVMLMIVPTMVEGEPSNSVVVEECTGVDGASLPDCGRMELAIEDVHVVACEPYGTLESCIVSLDARANGTNNGPTASCAPGSDQVVCGVSPSWVRVEVHGDGIHDEFCDFRGIFYAKGWICGGPAYASFLRTPGDDTCRDVELRAEWARGAWAHVRNQELRRSPPDEVHGLQLNAVVGTTVCPP